MKQLFLVVALVAANSSAMDKASLELEKAEKLVTARLRWLGNEDLFLYSKMRLSIPGSDDCTIDSRSDGKLLALVDMGKHLITTYLSVPADETKTITHTFNHFKEFLDDEALMAEVAKCQRLKKNLSILCSIQ